MTQRDDLATQVDRKARRLARSRQRGGNIWRQVAQMGTLGWMMVLPMVLGAALGRVLQRVWEWHAAPVAGLVLGVFVGMYAAGRQGWRNVAATEETEDDGDAP